jgi:ADP-ribose pyrophosphatase YjhB (NUDIX family)
VGVVLLRDTQVLLIRRATPPRQGEWSLPGGGQELGETVEHCARRELEEETGCTAGPLMLIDVIDAIRHDAAGRVQFHYTLVDFAARWAGGEARAGGDCADVAWAPSDALAPYALWTRTQEVIAQAVAMLGR